MGTYIKISTLNDFVFCPRSIYFHELYSRYDIYNYHQTEQLLGSLNHKNIENKKYSTSKDILQGISIFSEKYGLVGKIDIYTENILIERKTKIKKIYKGYIWQLYAQYFCMVEMGFNVERLKLYSLKDNKTYQIPLPSLEDIIAFENLIEKYKEFDFQKPFNQNINKCKKCIYSTLCDFYKL